MSVAQVYYGFYLLEFILYFILYSILVLKMRKAEISIPLRIWIIVSLVYISDGIITVLMYLAPRVSQLIPTLIEDNAVEKTFISIIRTAAFIAFPSLFFWHNGAPYNRVPSDALKTKLADESASSTAEKALVEKRTVWQQVCFTSVICNVAIIIASFLIIQRN